MSYSAKIEMVQGDDLPAIVYTIKDKNTAASGQELDSRDSDTWAVVDLTGFTCNVDVRRKNDSALLETLPLSIVSAVGGDVLLNISEALFKKDFGDYELETVLTSGAGAQQTIYNMMLVRVRSRIKATA